MLSNTIQSLRKDIVFNTVLHGFSFTFHSTWGLFSPTEVDEGSIMLIKAVSVKSTDTILEVGSGYGPIGLTLAKLAPQGSAHLLDKDFVAVEYTKKNAHINEIQNTEVFLSNGFSNVMYKEYDVIVSNLPAKVGKEMLHLILYDAKIHLKKGGKLYVVVIAGLKDFIKKNFIDIFGNFEKVTQCKTYLVALAIK